MEPTEPIMHSIREIQGADAPDRGAIFDRQASIEQVGGDADLLDALIEAYLGQEPALLASLQSAVEQRDSPSIRKAAHALVSCVSAIGAARSRAAARELEEMARQQQLDHVTDAHRTVIQEFQLLRQSVQKAP